MIMTTTKPVQVLEEDHKWLTQKSGTATAKKGTKVPISKIVNLLINLHRNIDVTKELKGERKK